MDLPEQLILDHFIRGKPPKIKYKIFKMRHDKYYIHNRGITKDLLDSVFVNENRAYRIISLEIGYNSYSPCVTFGIIEYMDDRIATLLERLKKVKEHLLVCSDCVEEAGGKKASDKVKSCAKDITLEDLV